ncbi:ATP-binding cassette domain-containing protein [Mycoplasma sp. 394]
MKKLFNNKPLLLYIFIFSIISVAASSIVVYFVASLIDSIKSGDKALFQTNLIVVISLTVIFLVATLMQLLLKNKLKQYVSTLLTKGAVSKISTLSSHEVTENKEGRYLVWINKRVPELQEFLFTSLFDTVIGVFVQVATLIVMFVISWKFALIGLAILLISFIFPFFLSTIAGRMHKKFMFSMESHVATLQNIFNGFKFLWYLNKPEKLFDFIDVALKKWLKDLDKTQSTVIKLEVINSGFQYISYILMMFIIGYFIFYQHEPLGAIFAVPGYFYTLSIQLRYTIYVNQNYIAYKSYLKDFSSEFVASNKDNAEINVEKIRITNLNFAYEENVIFKDFNFTFYKGKKYAIVGKSGSGKSTLLNLILKQLHGYNGSIKVNDQEIKDIDVSVWNNSFTYLNSNENVFYDSIYNNVTLWKENMQDQVKLALKQANLTEFNLDYVIESDTALSTGQKQRLNFARHFYRNKNLLILDEAASNLDKENTEDLFHKLMQNPDLLLINCTHHLDDASLYDAVINLEVA